MNLRFTLIAFVAAVVAGFAPASSKAVPPSNDNFANRMKLTGQAVSSTPVQIDDATREGLERSDTDGQTVWYTWTASKDGIVTITTAGTTYRNRLTAFNGDGLADLVLIVSDTESDTASVSFFVKAGLAYQCCIGCDYDDETGTAVLNISNKATTITSPTVVGVPAGGNDLFADAVKLPGSTVSGFTYALEATRESQEPESTENNTVWWTWTATSDATVSVNTAGSSYRTRLEVFTGAALSNLTLVGTAVDSTSATVNFNAKAGTTYHISVGADYEQDSDTDSVVNVNATPLHPPVITSATSSNVFVGSSYSYRITATNAPLEYSASGLPSGLGLNTSTGVISGTPKTVGTYNVMIAATNNKGTGSATLHLIVKALIPVVNSPTTATAHVGKAFAYKITASNSPASYAASGLPSGLGLSTTTGNISGTPKEAGTFHVALKATNSGGTGTATLTLTVLPASPVITSPRSEAAALGKSFSYQITAANSPTSYGASGLPGGLKIDQTTGKITGTATKTGTYTVTIAAFNTGGSGSATLTLTVETTPVITSAKTATGNLHSAFSYQIAATNHPTSFGESDLPPGLSINQTTGKISGTPTKTGTFKIIIAAVNVAGKGVSTLTLTVKIAKPVITSSLNPPSRQGVAFSYQITASNSPTSYGESGLPKGLVIDQKTGKITGKPTKAGTYAVTIAAFNAGGSGTAKMTLVVKPPL